MVARKHPPPPHALPPARPAPPHAACPHHDDGHSVAVVLRAPGAAHHLQHVGDGVVHVPPAGAVSGLGSAGDVVQELGLACDVGQSAYRLRDRGARCVQQERVPPRPPHAPACCLGKQPSAQRPPLSQPGPSSLP